MTRDEFIAQAREAGVDSGAYCIDGGYDNEKYVLVRDSGGWSVYYSERGLQRDLRNFRSEGDAWAELLARLLKDTTSRVRRG